VTNGWEAIDGAEVAGHVDGYEEEIGFIRIKSPNIAVQQSSVDCNLGGKQVFGTPRV
jgi:hypothetical protein